MLICTISHSLLHVSVLPVHRSDIYVIFHLFSYGNFIQCNNSWSKAMMYGICLRCFTFNVMCQMCYRYICRILTTTFLFFLTVLLCHICQCATGTLFMFQQYMTFVLLFHLFSYVDYITAITFVVKQWLVVPTGIISHFIVKMDSLNHSSSGWRVPKNCVKLTVSVNHTSQIPFTAQYLHDVCL